MKHVLLSLALAIPSLPLSAQVLSQPRGGNGAAPRGESAPAQPAAPAENAASSGNSGNASAPPPNRDNSFFGGDMPTFNPSTELITWNGENWNVNDNRLFQARFEKYLNAPEANTEDDLAYNELLNQIMDFMSPHRVRADSADRAFELLAQGSAFEIDANLCDAIANQVYTSWQAKKSRRHLEAANQNLEKERQRLEWNSKMAASDNALSGANAPRDNRAAQREWQRQQQLVRDATMQPYIVRLAEVNALLKKNDLTKEISELQAKLEFQALIVQLFFQRRFQHVVIATRFYRSIFAEGESQLRVGEDAKSLFAKTTGMPPTIGTLDAMANEIMRDVNEGVQACKFLLEKEELESATKRLAETFVVGEYMPSVRTLPRDDKREVLSFAQKANQLISAIDVKDYTLAEKLVNEIQEIARDFDASKPLAVIETARTVSAMHLAKARNAAVSGDTETLETELRAATEIWPRNPALQEVSALIFSQADVQQRAMVDFDQLISQKNYRQIYDDRVRLIAATALHPERAAQLQEVLENMAQVEGAIIRAQEIEKRGDFIGAWESAERAYQQFPEDNKLNSVRADLTTKAADFVRALRTAEELEQKGQSGSSLAWYLKAQNQYPPSEMAREGIHRMVDEVMPDAI